MRFTSPLLIASYLIAYSFILIRCAPPYQTSRALPGLSRLKIQRSRQRFSFEGLCCPAWRYRERSRAQSSTCTGQTLCYSTCLGRSLVGCTPRTSSKGRTVEVRVSTAYPRFPTVNLRLTSCMCFAHITNKEVSPEVSMSRPPQL